MRPMIYRELAGLISEVVPGSNLNDVMPFVMKPKDGDYCLMRDADSGKVVAYNYFHMTVSRTPFMAEALPVIHFGSSYKHPQLRGVNVIWDLGRHYANHKLGRFWFLKKFVGLSRTINPRVVEYWFELFPEVHPQPGEDIATDIHDFNRDYHAKYLDMEILLDKCPYSVHPFTQPGEDFTEMWNKKYHSRRPEMNRFILDYEMVKYSEGRYYLTDRLVHLVGYYDPMKAILSKVIGRRNAGRPSQRTAISAH